MNLNIPCKARRTNGDGEVTAVALFKSPGEYRGPSEGDLKGIILNEGTVALDHYLCFDDEGKAFILHESHLEHV